MGFWSSRKRRKRGFAYDEIIGIRQPICQRERLKDFALVKFCLCSMGIMIGTQVTPKHRKKVIALSAMVFLITYIPLMAKFFKIVFEKNHENE